MWRVALASELNWMKCSSVHKKKKKKLGEVVGVG